MYENLKIEMSNKGITQKDIARLLGLRIASVCDKINGKFSFKLDEAFKIRDKYFKDLTIEYLFEISSKEQKIS